MMNQEDIFKKVGQILNELQDQYDFLAQNPAQLNELELELFLANANFLSDHVQILKKINSSKPLLTLPEHAKDQSPLVLTPAQEPESVTEQDVTDISEQLQTSENVQEPEMPKEKTLEELEAEYATANEPELGNIDFAAAMTTAHPEKTEEETVEPLKFEFLLNDAVDEDRFEFEEQPVETIFDRPLSKEEEEILAEKKKLRDDSALYGQVTDAPVSKQEELKPEPTALVQDKPETKVVQQPADLTPVPDKPEEKVVNPSEQTSARPTLNDLLAGKNSFSGSINEDNNKPVVTNLRQAINLNEKLLYIKDLFNGYNLAYAEAIELVDKMPDFKTADNFLRNNYAVKNNWAAKQGTVDQFYELLNQRFGAK